MSGLQKQHDGIVADVTQWLATRQPALWVNSIPIELTGLGRIADAALSAKMAVETTGACTETLHSGRSGGISDADAYPNKINTYSWSVRPFQKPMEWPWWLELRQVVGIQLGKRVAESIDQLQPTTTSDARHARRLALRLCLPLLRLGHGSSI
jgi:hypothetical protein